MADQVLGCGGSAVIRGLDIGSKFIAQGGMRCRKCSDGRRVWGEGDSDSEGESEGDSDTDGW